MDGAWKLKLGNNQRSCLHQLRGHRLVILEVLLGRPDTSMSKARRPATELVLPWLILICNIVSAPSISLHGVWMKWYIILFAASLVGPSVQAHSHYRVYGARSPGNQRERYVRE